MMLRGRVYKNGAHWLIECPALDAMSQAKTKREAYEMLVDWIQTALDQPKFEVAIIPDSATAEGFDISFVDFKPIMGLMIERTRQKHEMTLDDIAKHMGLKSRSNISHYETGKHALNLDKAQEIFDAMGYDVEISIKKRA